MRCFAVVYSLLRRVESRLLKWQRRQVGESAAEAGPTQARPARFTARLAKVARLVAGSLQALGPAAPMARTRNQYCVPLTSPVAMQLDTLPS
jgi:hypothetical protein